MSSMLQLEPNSIALQLMAAEDSEHTRESFATLGLKTDCYWDENKSPAAALRLVEVLRSNNLRVIPISEVHKKKSCIREQGERRWRRHFAQFQRLEKYASVIGQHLEFFKGGVEPLGRDGSYRDGNTPNIYHWIFISVVCLPALLIATLIVACQIPEVYEWLNVHNWKILAACAALLFLSYQDFWPKWQETIDRLEERKRRVCSNAERLLVVLQASFPPGHTWSYMRILEFGPKRNKLLVENCTAMHVPQDVMGMLQRLANNTHPQTNGFVSVRFPVPNKCWLTDRPGPLSENFGFNPLRKRLSAEGCFAGNTRLLYIALDGVGAYLCSWEADS